MLFFTKSTKGRIELLGEGGDEAEVEAGEEEEAKIEDDDEDDEEAVEEDRDGDDNDDDGDEDSDACLPVPKETKESLGCPGHNFLASSNAITAGQFAMIPPSKRTLFSNLVKGSK